MALRRRVPEPETRVLAWTPGERSEKTRDRLLQGARLAFLNGGYEGTRIDDIAAAASVSRATFYVYFPSKRDAFLALGVDSERDAYQVLAALRDVPSPPPDPADLSNWVGLYIAHFDRHGAFDRLWRQATATDQALHDEGLRHELAFARRLGQQLDRLRGSKTGDPTLQGLCLSGMVEGVWLTSERSGVFTREVVIEALVASLRGLLA